MSQDNQKWCCSKIKDGIKDDEAEALGITLQGRDTYSPF